MAKQSIHDIKQALAVFNPQITPVSMKSNGKYVYKIKGKDGCYLLTGYNKDENTFLFKKHKC